MTQISGALQGFTDQQLVTELERRKSERIEKEKAARRSKEVEVICPKCDGRGQEPATSHAPTVPYQNCLMCNGSGRIKAVRT